MIINNQKGAAPLIFLLIVFAVIGFITITNFAPFKNGLLSSIFKKDASHASGGTVNLSLLPGQQNINPGGSFKVDVMMDPQGAQVSAAQIQVNFDPKIVQATQISNSGMFTQTLMPGSISEGKAAITLGASPSGTVTGTGVIATIMFNALTTPTNSSQIVLDPSLTMVAAIGVDTNVAGILTPAAISIGSPTSAAASSTPLPTPQMSPSLLPSLKPSPVQTPTPVPSPTVVPSANSNTVKLEAESMSLIANSRALQIFADTQASGGKAVVFYSNATSTGTFTLPAKTASFNIRAKGDLCKGAPQMILKIDNVQVSRKATSVSSSGWVDYLFTKSLNPGTHTLSVTFTNDYTNSRGGTCDRNLRVDQITFK